jgi:hypothetical protein
LKLNKIKPNTMSPPAANKYRDGRHRCSAKPVISKPNEWNWCWAKALCTAVGMPAANTGKCAKAALKTTLEPALKAPRLRNDRAQKVLERGAFRFMSVRFQVKQQTALEHAGQAEPARTAGAQISGLR